MWFLIWIALAFLVGKLAETRGRGFGNWLFLSIIFSPLLMVIILYCKENLISEQENLEKNTVIENKRETEIVLKKLLDTNQFERYEYLQYKEKSGTLTQEEFSEIKQFKKMESNYKIKEEIPKELDKMDDLDTVEKLYFKQDNLYSKQLILERALTNNSIKNEVKDTLEFLSDEDIIENWQKRENITLALEIFRREIKNIL